jgi:acyl-CoA thioester hydrolase
MRFHNQQFVRWDDIDAFGHVNNAKYLTFIQEARFQWSYVQLVDRNEIPTIVEMVVAKADIDFISPIYEGGRYIDVHLWVDSISNSSFVMGFELSSKGTIFAKAKTVQVMVSLETKKSRPISPSERHFLESYLEEK